MAISAGLKLLFDTTVTIEPRSSVDEYDKPTYGSAVTYPAHIERSADFVRGEFGPEVVNRRKVFLYHTAWTSANIPTVNDRLTLDANHNGIKPQIMMVQISSDEKGISHVVLWC
jgi:hypothetical protein